VKKNVKKTLKNHLRIVTFGIDLKIFNAKKSLKKTSENPGARRSQIDRNFLQFFDDEKSQIVNFLWCLKIFQKIDFSRFFRGQKNFSPGVKFGGFYKKK
jgi:hypothetical protein